MTFVTRITMQNITLSCPNRNISGEITLDGSKSISNRVLLIRALCNQYFKIDNLSHSDDTITMERLLNSHETLYDAGHAGTTFRFLTAYLAVKEGTQILTGSERMKQRPISHLVTALNDLGANISYVEKEGYPPIKIGPPATELKDEITLSADVSSQFVSALLMIAPTLPNGLTLHLDGEIVSEPYIRMTLSIMEYFGVASSWKDKTIKIPNQSYQVKDFTVEADWSAASYYYAIAALSDTADLTLKGLQKGSIQGDVEIVEIAKKFGIQTHFGDNLITIVKASGTPKLSNLEQNFTDIPDLTQTVSVICAGLGTIALFSGLHTLRIKETDRIAALQSELLKLQVFLNKMPEKFSKKSGIEYFMQEGIATCVADEIPVIETFDDHRMAMAFAPLALIFPISIKHPEVVSKSYPDFWKDLRSLGFIMSLDSSQ